MDKKTDFVLLGICQKLGNKAWGSHQRALALSKTSISYFKQVPKDFDEIYSKKVFPKGSLPIDAIVCVKSLDASEDKSQIKKLGSLSSDQTFKIMFKKDAISKGKYAETTKQPIAEMKKIDSWYIAIRSTPETKNKGLPTALDWITSITV